ncbi:MAG TPA: FixH family protein [Flavobacteriaceae bacterium]|nr:FixH family protein [Flavobacteriaceae bacterium]
MKINWGTGLVIGLGLFIAFIMYFVIRISLEHESELVTENYYEKELVFQKQIDGAANVKKAHAELKGKRQEEGYELTFPENMEPSAIEGTLTLYRPSNKKLDHQEKLSLKSDKLLIPKDYLVSGRWDIIVAWTYEGKDYYHKQKINY